MAVTEDKPHHNLLKAFDDGHTITVPRICLLPQLAPVSGSIETGNLHVPPVMPPTTGFKYSHRDSGSFDSLSMGSKVNISCQITTVNNWFKHLPGSDQVRVMAALYPAVHFDYMAMIAALAAKQVRFISEEVLDYQTLEEDANSLDSLSILGQEPTSLAVNLLSRLPLLHMAGDCVEMMQSTAAQPNKRTSPSVHTMYAKLLTQVFTQDFSDMEDLFAVRQLATLTVHHPNLLPQLQIRLMELATERHLLDEKEEPKRPRRPGVLSPFGGPGQLTQTHSFSLLVPQFLGGNCLSASASPQSACSYNSSGFMSGAESYGRRTHPPLSPQSSTSSCAGDDQMLPHSVSYDPDNPCCSGSGIQGCIDGNDISSSSGSRSDNRTTASIHGQSSIDTPTPSSSSSVLAAVGCGGRSSVIGGGNLMTCSTCNAAVTAGGHDSAVAAAFFGRDDEVDSEAGLMDTISCSGGLGGRCERNTFAQRGSGMSNVPSWLKSLRLHKYAGLFQQLDYDEMLGITDDWLEGKNVTKGARNKILLNIQKLESRQSTLRQIESDLISSGSIAALRACVSEVKHVLTTPIRLFSPDSTSGYVMTASSGIDSPPHSINGNVAQGDLPGQIVRCLSRVCSQLLVSKKVDEESYGTFIHNIETIIDHDSFTSRHKNLCMSWRSQLENVKGPPRKATIAGGELQRILPHRKGGSASRQQLTMQACSFSNVNASTTIRPPTPACSMIDHFCPVPPTAAAVGFHLVPSSSPHPSYMSQTPQACGEVPLPIHLSTVPGYLHHQQQALKRQVERTMSAPNQSALMELFLQCQTYPVVGFDSLIDQQPLLLSPPLPVPSATPLSLPSATSRIVPTWSSSAVGSEIIPNTSNDTSPNGSQDPATAEINRSLDLLAREVTELAIRDPESPKE